MYILLSELLEEADVILENETQVSNLEAAHSGTLQTHTKGPAGVLLRINAATTQNLRVDHTGTQQFNPAFAVTGGANIAIHFSYVPSD